MKGAQEEAVKDGHWPAEYLVYFVPSCREDLHDGVRQEDEEQSDDAICRLVRVPEAHGEDYVCNKMVRIWSNLHGKQFGLGTSSCG